MSGGFFTAFLRWCALLIALACAAPAFAGVRPSLCVAPRAAASVDTAAPIAPATRFDCTTPQTAFGPGDYLVDLRFPPQADSLGDPLVLRSTVVWQDGATLHFRYADGAVERLSFRSTDVSRFISLGAVFEFPIPARAAPLTGITIATDNTGNMRGIWLGAELMKRSESYAAKASHIALYAGFAGLALALVVYNFGLWVALRHRFQLVYCAMVTSLAAYTFTSSGAVMLVFPGIANNDRLRLNYVLLFVAATIALTFVREFFGSELVGRRFNRFVTAVMGTGLAAALAFALFAPWQIGLLDRLYFLAGAAVLSLVIPFLWQAWRTRNRYLALFLFAWSAPILTTAARILHGFGLVPFSFWLDNSNLVALGIESLLSTSLVIARLRELSEDRDSARMGEVSALRLANSDPLTGLLNRRAFLELTAGRGERYRLMLFDIDQFKDVNDRVGHEIGDEVLRRIAKAIQSVRPAESLAVRLGGEEFGLLVPETRAFLCPPELMLEAIRCQPMPLELHVTVSLGYAEGLVGTDADWKRLYRFADGALYRAKADGRDRACRATDFKELKPAKRVA